MWTTLKNTWIKYVTIYNKTVITCLLTLVWFLVLTPTAIIRRFFLIIFTPKKKKDSFLIKTPPLSSNHFKNPF